LGKLAGVELKLYDVTGRLIRSLGEAAAAPGAHSLVWDGNSGDGRPCPSGVYLYSWRAGGKEAKGKIVITR
jgi:flagellar hook assembly protein FlgD